MYSVCELQVALTFMVSSWLLRLDAHTDATDSPSITTATAIETNPCPVVLQRNHSNHCNCGGGLSEIWCYNMDAIPTFIQDGTFYNGLYITKQDIASIPHSSFFNIRVKKIVLDFNPLGHGISSSALSGLEGYLYELSLGACQIHELPHGLLAGMIELRYLHLWGNKLKEIPPNIFNRAPELVEIHLWGNKISQLHKNAFSGLRKLTKLDLDNNELTQLDHAMFRHLDKLMALHLGHNHITYLYEETFIQVASLRILNLDHNGLEVIYPTAFKGLSGLLSLSLNDNDIERFREYVFSHFGNLTTLNLQNNALKSRSLMPNHFEDLRALQLVNLSGNNISQLPEDIFKSCSKLTHVNLDNNIMQEVKVSLFKSVKHLRSLSLLGNPLRCDSKLSWLVEMAERGTEVWGTCNETKAGYPTSPTDRVNYVGL